ncbi:UTP--glucose-1-phosphate uridylyltransferase [compost metagenome]
MLIEQETVDAFHMTGLSHDCGNKLGYMKANIAYAMRHHEIGQSVTDHLHALTLNPTKKVTV